MKSRPLQTFVNHFWNSDNGLVSVLVILVLIDFLIVPVFYNNTIVAFTVKIFWIFFLFSGIIAMIHNRVYAIIIMLIPAVQLFTGLADVWIDGHWFDRVAAIPRIANLALLVGLMLTRIFKPGPVGAYRIMGSIVVYILLANCWSEFYLFLFRLNPQSFSIAEKGFDASHPQQSFFYFSVITLTTTGFGEIVPVMPIARSLVQLEAITGVLYPTILISRLVSGSVTNKAAKKAQSDKE